MPRYETIILFGGSSNERRVSVASAQNLTDILPQATLWFWTPQGEVFHCNREPLKEHTQPFSRDFTPPGTPTHPSLERALATPTFMARLFLLALHGGSGEDGTVQRLLEERGLAFTGSGSKASALAFDKVAAKARVESQGMRTAGSRVLPSGDAAGATQLLTELQGRYGKVIVKPVAGGSSIGLHRVHSAADVARVAGAVAQSAEAFLAEEEIPGTELTVGVVEDSGGVRALPVSEVRVAQGRAFDFDGKYLGSGTQELTPAQVPPEVSRAAQDAALLAHKALGCRGYSRTDFISTDRGPVFLETNTLPGLTRASFIPQQLQADGTSLEAFLKGQIELALDRGRRDAT